MKNMHSNRGLSNCGAFARYAGHLILAPKCEKWFLTIWL